MCTIPRLQQPCRFLVLGYATVLLVNTDSCRHARLPAHEKKSGNELNLLILVCNFHGLKGLLLAHVFPIPVTVEGWAKTRAGHQEISGEKGALHEEPAKIPAIEQMALVFHPSCVFLFPWLHFYTEETVIIRS